MTKLKKLIKNNWMMTLIYTFGLLAAIVAGWLLGRPNMLHAAVLPGNSSNITYNENQQLCNSNNTECMVILSNASGGTTYYNFIVSNLSTGAAIRYLDCTYDSSTKDYTCLKRQAMYANSTPGAFTTTAFMVPTVNNSGADYIEAVNNNGTLIGDYYITSGSGGYSEQEYLAYGQQQYNAGYSAGVAYVQAHPAEYNLYTAAQYNANYTAGQNSVINSPNTYGLYTQAQYEANYTSGYNAGVAYVQNHPSEYNLYTTAQYNAYGSSQYTAGQNAVLNNPNSYNLYTTAQYNAYGSSQYTAGETAVQNDPNSYGLYTSTQMTNNYNAGVQYVLDHPSEYNLYTTQQYNDNAQAQYNAGYAAGLVDDTAAYNAGIQYVIDNPNDYNLYTPTQYTEYGTQQYNEGIQHVVDNPGDYSLYTTTQYNDRYQEGYQAGITQGENNVTSSPNDYGLYTEQQYTNNGTDSSYIVNLIDSVWVNQPTLNSGTGYYVANWTKINNNLLSINQGSVDLSNVYSNYSNITDIRIYYKDVLTSDLPLYFKNITDPSYYENVEVQLRCYLTIPSNAINDDMDNRCQTSPGLYGGTINFTGIEYSRLINNTNYFDAMYGTDEEMMYFTNMRYNCLVITQLYGNNIAYLNSNLNQFNYDLNVINFSSYNMGYDKGYNTGLQANQQSVYNGGYNDGFEAANAIYEDTGAGGNTLVGLAGTVLFSPIKMMKQIFNFEILGINIAGFVLSIITLFVVIWLIKRLI